MAARRFREDTADSFNKAMSRSGYGHAVTTLDFVHRQVHDGFMFFVTHTAIDLADGAGHDIMLTTSATAPGAKPHVELWLHKVGDGPGYYRLYEGVTASNDGTALVEVNYERPSSKTAGVVATHTPTISDLGTLIYEERVMDPGTTPSKDSPSGSGTVVGSIEFILKANTKYVFRIQNGSGGTMDTWQEIGWYELDQERADYR